MILSEATLAQHDGEQGNQHPLTEKQVRTLLAERGYHLVERVQHVHASHNGQEWHICQCADLAWLTPAQFLHRLEEALGFRIVSPERLPDPVRST